MKPINITTKKLTHSRHASAEDQRSYFLCPNLHMVFLRDAYALCFIVPLSSAPNCPCNHIWYCQCPFTFGVSVHPLQHVLKRANLGVFGTGPCGWQQHFQVVKTRCSISVSGYPSHPVCRVLALRYPSNQAPSARQFRNVEVCLIKSE